jgi:hypothetical protein
MHPSSRTVIRRPYGRDQILDNYASVWTSQGHGTEMVNISYTQTPMEDNCDDECQLKCNECLLKYVGQTGRTFEIRYKEYIRAIETKRQTSKYAQHILDTAGLENRN